MVYTDSAHNFLEFGILQFPRSRHQILPTLRTNSGLPVSRAKRPGSVTSRCQREAPETDEDSARMPGHELSRSSVLPFEAHLDGLSRRSKKDGVLEVEMLI